MLKLLTEFAFTIHAELAEPEVIGKMAQGVRRYVRILGGSVSGPKLTGSVLAGGGDSQLVLSDTLLELEARYFLRASDGTGISVVNKGLRRAPKTVTERLLQGESVDASEYYFRTSPRFEAPLDSAHAWLNESLFVASAERQKLSVIVHVHRVL